MERRILFLHETFPAGGAERVTMDIAGYLAGFHYQTMVCCRVRNDWEYTPHVQVIELPDKSYLQSEENIDFLVATIRSLRIDVFVLPVQALPEVCENIKSRTSCRLVFALHSIPLWEVTYRLYEKKKNSRGSVGKWLEWYLLTYPKTVWLKKYTKNFVRIYRRVYELSDAYTVLCDEYKRMLVEKLRLSPEEADKITVIHNSERRATDVAAEKKKQLLFVGRLTYEDKRVDRLLKIWKSVGRKAPDWELILVGDGPERSRLEAYIAKHRIARVRLAGHTDHVSSYYHEAAVLCLTSTFEGWPLCLTEAQTNGVVPVAFDCTAGVRRILAPSGVNGLLIPPYRRRTYAKRLLHLLQNEEERRQMQRNVTVKAQDYSPDKVGEKWRLLFEHLCNQIDNR